MGFDASYSADSTDAIIFLAFPKRPSMDENYGSRLVVRVTRVPIALSIDKSRTLRLFDCAHQVCACMISYDYTVLHLPPLPPSCHMLT